MVIPYRDPRKLLVAQQKVGVGAVCSQSLSVVVQGVDLPIRLGHPTNALPIPVFAVGVLVDVVSQMDDIVDRVFARSVTVSIEEAEREIAARIDCEANLGDQVVGRRRCFGPANRTGDVG